MPIVQEVPREGWQTPNPSTAPQGTHLVLSEHEHTNSTLEAGWKSQISVWCRTLLSAQGMGNCYTSVFLGANRNPCLEPTKRHFTYSAGHKGWQWSPALWHWTKQPHVSTGQAWEEDPAGKIPQMPSVRGRAAWNTNPPDFIAHDLFRSGLSVPRALSAAQGSVTAPQEWKDFYYQHNCSMLTAVLRQKPWNQRMLDEKFHLYYQYFVLFYPNYFKILHVYPNYTLNANIKSDLQQESFRRISFILKRD